MKEDESSTNDHCKHGISLASFSDTLNTLRLQSWWKNISKSTTNCGGRIMPLSKKSHILILRTCECHLTFKNFADVIKLRTLRWGGYAGRLSVITKVFKHVREAQKRGSEWCHMRRTRRVADGLEDGGRGPLVKDSRSLQQGKSLSLRASRRNAADTLILAWEKCRMSDLQGG